MTTCHRRAGRLPVVLAGCLVFGVAMEGLKAQNGPGFEIRSALGNMSTPWLVMPLLAGACTRGRLRGACAGLMATVLALVGFYVTNALIFPEPGGWRPTVLVFARIMSRWLVLGLVSGSVMGAIGASLRSRGTALVLIGASLVLEPLVLAVLTDVQLPWPLNMRWGSPWGLVACLEAVAGAAAVLLGVTARRRARTS